MKCPVCADVTLSISSREGIEIDHCPQCRGVWLDRGELDKIIDRAAPAVMGTTPPAPQANDRHVEDRRRDDGYRDDGYRDDRYRDDRYRDDRYRDDRYRGDRYPDDRYRKKKKRKSILEEIFDFD